MTPLGMLIEATPGLSAIRLRNCILIVHRRMSPDPEEGSIFVETSLYMVSRWKHVQLLDVSDPDEWDAGHLETAINVPLAELGGRLGELDAGLPVVAVCSTGMRSGKAVDLLTANGFNAEGIEGGTEALARLVSRPAGLGKRP